MFPSSSNQQSFKSLLFLGGAVLTGFGSLLAMLGLAMGSVAVTKPVGDGNAARRCRPRSSRSMSSAPRRSRPPPARRPGGHRCPTRAGEWRRPTAESSPCREAQPVRGGAGPKSYPDQEKAFRRVHPTWSRWTNRPSYEEKRMNATDVNGEAALFGNRFVTEKCRPGNSPNRA